MSTNKKASRDTYDDLFSSDSSSISREVPRDFGEHILNVEKNEFVFSGITMVANERNNNKPPSSSESSFQLLRSNISKVESQYSGSDMDISSDSSSMSDSHSAPFSIRSSDSSLDGNESVQMDSTSQSMTEFDQSPEQTPAPVISFLDEDEIANLLGENIQLPNPEPRETLEKNNVDIIGSFNVRNKYNHITAGELLIKEKLTFLSIQEPYASSHKVSESWKAFQKIELQSARISCYETPYQIILFDSWKWGGKIICEFQSLQYGRIASIAFDLGNDFQLGIISVYAPTKASKDANITDNSSHPSMHITNTLVQKILNKWQSKFPGMATIILGDFQETISSSDRDNLGKYRQEPSQDGVLMGLCNSHRSIVREMNPEISYVTRFGKEGARGIDHIFVPSDDNFKNICTDANIKRDIGANYFPSDHSLITCSIPRMGQNNNCGGNSKTKYEYNKLFNIKLKQSGPLGINLEFDSSQFKNCRKYKDQEQLFNEIQKVTGEESYLTKNVISELDLRADLLFENLWTSGLEQQVDGPVNKLVRIQDSHAAEISYILKEFNASVKMAMANLRLCDERNSNESAGKTRGRLRQRSGFKLFNNLPVPTKLRYLKTNVEAKIKDVSKNIYWLNEFYIRQTHEHGHKQFLSQQDFWAQWSKILKSDTIVKRAKEVAEAYENEGSERTQHVEAIQHEIDKGSHFKNKMHGNKHPCAGNTLPFVPDNVTRLLNFWLSNSNCHQGFNSTSTKETSTAFLLHRVNDWKDRIMELDVTDFDVSIPHQFKLIKTCLEKAQADLHKFCNQITKLQSFYRQATLDYFLESNNISSFTNKVSHKSRQAPAAHTSIWDPALMEFRACTDELEELRATSAFHGTWMANSASQETCAFAKIVSKGRLGNRGVKLDPNRIVTMKDIKQLIHKGDSLPRKLKKAFIKAHGPHTANLFREPKEDRSEFFYPFYLLNELGHTKNDENLEKNLWKAISSIPTKARFEGFQLAVIGRFGLKWRKLLLKIVKLILVMRYIPPCLKKMARFPIPKPGKHNEYRPISLCHDLYCYIMGVVTSYSSDAIGRAGILHEGLTAYQKGKGCSNLVTTELCFREDCLENHIPSVQIDEDEEKFFDRIPVEILLAAMRVNGFPEQGYIEIKASAMESKTVEIITAKGITYARFICGLEQGNPDSPTISNLVIKFKHDIWNHISRDIQTILNKNQVSHQGGYLFNSVNKEDGIVYLCKIGYSDDNSKYISVHDENDLLLLVNYFTQLSGDLSMVTKIGRKSAKCEVQFFNITADLTLKMEKVWSTAWSFVDDSPIEEQIPFKVHMKPAELQKFYIISDFFNLPEEEQINWNKIIGNNASKHLGLSCTLGADTSTAWQKTIEKMKEKISKLNIYKMQTSAQRKCFNMLVGSIPTFASVQMNFPSQELLKFDRYAATFFLKSNGLSKSDSKLRLFLPEEMGGLGMLSTMELDLISIAREFEVISNNITLDSRAFRTRISALDNYPLHALFISKNHARDAIAKLARYGIYVRDSGEEDINYILSKMSTTNSLYKPCTHPDYKDGCNIGIGLGKEKNKDLMYGGPIHSILQLLQANNWKSSPEIISAAKPYRIPVRKLISFHSEIAKIQNKDFEAFLSVWEWRNHSFNKLMTIPKHHNEWAFKNAASTEGLFNQSLNEKREKSIRNMEFPWIQHIRYIDNSKELAFNSYSWEGRFLRFLMKSASPVILATDGAHGEMDQVSSKTTSSFVLSVLDIRQGETLESRQWENRTVIPLMSRVSILPENFGHSESDIAHGEFCALIMAEIAFTSLPRITVSDSKAIREQALKIRDLKDDRTDRYYIRSVAGGVGKFVSGIMKYLLFQSNKPNNTYPNFKAMEIIRSELQHRNSSFLDIAEGWAADAVREKDIEINHWEKQYFDNDLLKPILKVNSHQLDPTGAHIKSPPRYKKLIPNLALLSANHHADVCADYGKVFPHVPFHFNNPPSYLRFFIVCGGKHLDRHVSDFCHNQFDLLKVRKLKLIKTQGLLWRVIPFTTTSWDILRLYKGWLRSLLGLTSTHTRRVYKSEIYRECCKKIFFKTHTKDNIRMNELKNANSSKTLSILSGCLWCKSERHIGCKPKGNRNHALLYCNHSDLKSFRTKSTNLIESKLRLFFLDLRKATSFENVENCLKELEKTFLQMQTKNLGRLRHMEPKNNNRYLSLANIFHREKIKCVQDALNSSKFNFCCELFGLLPNSLDREIQDDQIGLIDCPWLGLMPICVDTIIKNRCDDICSFVMHKETAFSLTLNLQNSWSEIKNLIMGRAIGAHRIICSTGKRTEKEWRKEFEIDINSIKRLKQDIQKTEKANSDTLILSKASGKRSYETCRGVAIQRERKTRKNNSDSVTTSYFKSCNGISCDQKCKSWFPKSNFSTNHIRPTLKQCQRCSRYMTALRKSKQILMDVPEETSQEKIIIFTQFLQSNCDSMQYNYGNFINRIKEISPASSKLLSETTKMKKISDGLKTTCNMLCVSIRKATNNFTSSEIASIHTAIKYLNKTLLCKESDFNLDREAETKIKLLTSNSNGISCKEQSKRIQHPSDDDILHSSPIKKSKPNPTDSTQILHNIKLSRVNTRGPGKISCMGEQCNPEKVAQGLSKNILEARHNNTSGAQSVADASDIKTTSKAKLQEFAARIIRPSRYMLGIEMTKAIEILRSFKTPNLYIASAEATNQISTWRLNQDWASFARMFNSRQVLDNKLNGTYLIPLFSGDTTSGHWSLCVVRKLGQRNMKAWCVDSLGRGNINANIASKIENAFAPGRAKLTWQECSCRCQEELECGPRTVLAMWIIQQNLTNEVSIEESINKATLQHAPYHSYTPTIIREKIAYFVNKFVPSMATPPIRLRKRIVRRRNRRASEAEVVNID